MVKMQAAVGGGAIGSSINSPLCQKFSLKLKNNHKNNHKNDKKAFSVAEAMIALLIGSVALGMAAPMITKQIKAQNMTDAQFRLINRENDRLQESVDSSNGLIAELIERVEALENENDDGIPEGMVAFFNATTCPRGWSAINANWNGRFPRFSGSHTVLSYNTSTKSFNSTGTAQTLNVGTTQEDAIRNVSGYGPALIYYHEDSYVKWVGLSGPFYKKYDSNNSTGGVRGAGNLGKALNANILAFDSSRGVPTAVENRPKSIALLGCVRN